MAPLICDAELMEGPVHTGCGAPHNRHMQTIEHTAVGRFTLLAINIKAFAFEFARASSVYWAFCILCERGLILQVQF